MGYPLPPNLAAGFSAFVPHAPPGKLPIARNPSASSLSLGLSLRSGGAGGATGGGGAVAGDAEDRSTHGSRLAPQAMAGLGGEGPVNRGAGFARNGLRRDVGEGSLRGGVGLETVSLAGSVWAPADLEGSTRGGFLGSGVGSRDLLLQSPEASTHGAASLTAMAAAATTAAAARLGVAEVRTSQQQAFNEEMHAMATSMMPGNHGGSDDALAAKIEEARVHGGLSAFAALLGGQMRSIAATQQPGGPGFMWPPHLPVKSEPLAVSGMRANSLSAHLAAQHGSSSMAEMNLLSSSQTRSPQDVGTMSAMGQPGTTHQLSHIVVKVTYGEDTIRFRVPSERGCIFQHIQVEVAKRLRLNNADFLLKYFDDDEEWVMLSSEEDMQECLRVAWATGANVVKLTVKLNC